jgi:hypothetical protein
LDQALAEGAVRKAEQAWHGAYLAALRQRQRWEGLIEVGDASLRMREVAKERSVVEATARRLYLEALFRARDQGSLQGVLRAAEAFAVLGDREVVEQCLYIAEQFAHRARDLHDQERVRVLRERLASRAPGAAGRIPSRLLPDEIEGP